MFVVPRPAVRRRVVQEFMSFYIDAAARLRETPWERHEFSRKCLANHDHLFDLARENQSTALDTLSSFIADGLLGAAESERTTAIAELVLSSELYYKHFKPPEYQEFYRSLVPKLESKLRVVASQDLVVALFLRDAGAMSFGDFLIEHGLPALFGPVATHLRGIVFPGLFDFLIESLNNMNPGPYPEDLDQDCQALGCALENADLENAIGIRDIPNDRLHFSPDKPDFDGLDELSPGVYFCAFVAGAVHYECREAPPAADSNELRIAQWIADIEERFRHAHQLNALVQLWNARTDPNRAPTDPLPFGPLQFSARQQQIIEEWVTQRLSIVRHEPHAESSR
jgi:hypothetical protein